MMRDPDAPAGHLTADIGNVRQLRRKIRRPYRLRVTFVGGPRVPPAIRYYGSSVELQREYEAYVLHIDRGTFGPHTATLIREQWSKVSSCYVPFKPVGAAR